MKSMFLIAVFTMLLASNAYGQLTLIDTRFVVLANNGSDYDVKVQIKTNSPTAHIGSSNFVFRFNHNSLDYPVTTQTSGPVSGTDYTYHAPFVNGLAYSSHITHNIRPGTGQHELSLNLVYNPIAPPGFGSIVGTSWIDFVTINFSVLNQSGNSALEWDTLSYYSPVFGDTNGVDAGHWWFKGTWQDLNTSPLPVELLSFSAYNQEDHVHLHWETATELNNFGFEVERREEGREWKTVGFVPGHGTRFYPQIYDWDDMLEGLEVPLSQQQSITYRLKQVDRDGSFEYSPLVEVAFKPVPGSIVIDVYPNPMYERAAVSVMLEESRAVDIGVYDINGRLIRRIASARELEAGSHAFDIDARELPSGIYSVRVSDNSSAVMKPFIVRK